jgi:hypothetical protein
MTFKRICVCMGLSLLFRAAPVEGIILNGTNVPKEKMVVYILIGHSNMAGIDAAHSDAVANPRCWNYPMATKTWVQAAEPKNAVKKGLSGNGSAGPGMPFLKGMAAAYPDYHFGVLTNASLSATCRGENTGNNGSTLDPADNRYWDSTYLYVQIMTAAKAAQKDVTIGGILCMLGTVDATRTSEAVCRAFSDDMTELIKDMRRDLGLPNLPFIMGEYEAGATKTFDPTLPLPGIIAAQTHLIPSKLPFSATVDSKGIQMLDDHHYTGDVGQGEWAKRAIAVIQANKFFPVAGTGIAQPIGGHSGLIAHRGEWTLSSTGAEVFGFEGSAWLLNGAGYAAPKQGAMTAPAGLTAREPAR